MHLGYVAQSVGIGSTLASQGVKASLVVGDRISGCLLNSVTHALKKHEDYAGLKCLLIPCIGCPSVAQAAAEPTLQRLNQERGYEMRPEVREEGCGQGRQVGACYCFVSAFESAALVISDERTLADADWLASWGRVVVLRAESPISYGISFTRKQRNP